MNRRDVLKAGSFALVSNIVPLKTTHPLNGRHQYEWDFATSIGDTIAEKYGRFIIDLETLLSDLSDEDVVVNSRFKSTVLIASREITSIFEIVRHGFDPAPLPPVEQFDSNAIAGLTFIGNLKRVGYFAPNSNDAWLKIYVPSSRAREENKWMRVPNKDQIHLLVPIDNKTELVVINILNWIV